VAGRDERGLPARFECGRRIRVAPAVYEAGPITCRVCGSDFASNDLEA
jgi:hypothetical protein